MADLSNEILYTVEAISRDKNLPKDSIISLIEHAMEEVAKKKYGYDNDIKVEINKKSGYVNLYRVLKIVEYVNDFNKEINIEDAQKLATENTQDNINLELGSFIYEPLPHGEWGRISANIARKVIYEDMKHLQREIEYNEFIDKVGDIVRGTVKKISAQDFIIDIGKAEGLLKSIDCIKSEHLNLGSRIMVLIKSVQRFTNNNYQITVSRTAEELLSKLMAVEIPEIYDGVIEIKGVARDPGSKAKVAVYSKDLKIDTIGCCVGVKGTRIKNISNEIANEKIDIVLWSHDPAQYIINSFPKIQISRIIINESKKIAEVIVHQDQLGLALGRNGQNVRLASKLTGFRIELLTIEQEAKRRLEEFNTNTETLIKVLDVEEIIAQVLTANGYNSIESIAASNISNLSKIEGFDEEIATEIHLRAKNYLNNLNDFYIQKINELGFDNELQDILQLDLKSIYQLASQGIKSPEDLAFSTVEEIKNILPDNDLTNEQIKNIIYEAKLLCN